MNNDIARDVAKSVVQSAPPVGVSVWQWFGSHDLNWYLAALVSVATLFYIGLQSFYLVRNNGKKVINEP
jgi:hypothetical protein